MGHLCVEQSSSRACVLAKGAQVLSLSLLLNVLVQGTTCTSIHGNPEAFLCPDYAMFFMRLHFLELTLYSHHLAFLMRNLDNDWGRIESIIASIKISVYSVYIRCLLLLYSFHQNICTKGFNLHDSSVGPAQSVRERSMAFLDNLTSDLLCKAKTLPPLLVGCFKKHKFLTYFW